jgi:hypothetical protein
MEWIFLIGPFFFVESKLFFKQATSWRPSATSDLMISVSSELSLRNPSLGARVPQLPVQVIAVSPHLFYGNSPIYHYENDISFPADTDT